MARLAELAESARPGCRAGAAHLVVQVPHAEGLQAGQPVARTICVPAAPRLRAVAVHRRRRHLSGTHGPHVKIGGGCGAAVRRANLKACTAPHLRQDRQHAGEDALVAGLALLHGLVPQDDVHGAGHRACGDLAAVLLHADLGEGGGVLFWRAAASETCCLYAAPRCWTHLCFINSRCASSRGRVGQHYSDWSRTGAQC